MSPGGHTQFLLRTTDRKDLNNMVDGYVQKFVPNKQDIDSLQLHWTFNKTSYIEKSHFKK